MVGKAYNLPAFCPCGNKFGVQHSLSCKKMCKDTKIEPKLIPFSREELQGRTSNNSNEARVDIRTRGFWERG